MEQFKSFITEAKEENYKVVVLTRKPKDNPAQNKLVTASKFEKAAKNIAKDKPKLEQKGLMAAQQPAQEEII